MTIILDAMGSDNYPDPEILGARDAIRSISEEIILVGDKKLINQKMEEFPL